jgi:protein-S-isoprenylcysteine O-methyltransferase Ste14
MPALLDLTLAGWAVFELGLRVRESVQSKGGTGQDRATRILIAAAIGGAIVVAVLTATRASSLRIPGPHRAAGLIVMWLGLAIRVWAVAALGSAFRTTVEVDPDQGIVSSGPYRWVRHPSYTGLLLIMVGLGLAAGNWLALASCVALPLAAVVRRIHVEEAELTRVLGQPYRDYRIRTKRLIPGLW